MTRIERIADLLMGAAYADRTLDGPELDKVKQLLRDMSRNSQLSAALEKRLERFRPGKQNVAEVCAGLGLTTDEQKRHILELVAKVQDADEVWDLDEDHYLRRVAKAIGASDALLEGLAVEEFRIEAVSASLLDGSDA
ncbi:MAG: TerB family tellurite resistance protein [Deltaproteobacteria bacterium]|nr:TerB family tellurite resistance protein [Deltaproteobacteria bacterium]